MPNPYHDANGRFCSKGEMRAAMDVAAESGDVKTYLALRADYEKASGVPIGMEDKPFNDVKKKKSLKKRFGETIGIEEAHKEHKRLYDEALEAVGGEDNMTMSVTAHILDTVLNRLATEEEKEQYIDERLAAADEAMAAAYDPNLATEKDLDDLEGSSNGNLHKFAEELQNERNIHITKADAKVLAGVLSQAHSEGYANGVNMELGDQTGVRYDAREEATSALYNLSFNDEKDYYGILSTLENILANEFDEGSAEGSWDA